MGRGAVKLSDVTLAAVVFVCGMAVGIATGPQIARNTGEEERGVSVETAAVVRSQETVADPDPGGEPTLEDLKAQFLLDQNELSAQQDDLKSRQDQTAQREAELDAEADELERKLASLDLREEDLARLQEELRVGVDALKDRQADLEQQEELIAARLQSVADREDELASHELKLAAQNAAVLAQEQTKITDAKPDLLGDQPVSKTAVNQKLSSVELNSIVLQRPASAGRGLEESLGAETFSEVDTVETELALSRDAPIAEVHFEHNSAKLTPGALQRAREAAARLQNMTFSKVRIAGHTDTTGSAGRNQVLSNQRAEAVAEIFVQAGLSRQVIEIVGFGETYAMLPVSTGDGILEPLNRCVGIFVE